MIKSNRGESYSVHGNNKMIKSDIEHDETPNCSIPFKEKKKRKYTKRNVNKKLTLQKLLSDCIGDCDLPTEEIEKRRREADAIRKRQKRHLMSEEERRAYLQHENERKRLQRLLPSFDGQRAKEALRKRQKRAQMSDAEREAFRKKDAARKRRAREKRKAMRLQNLNGDQAIESQNAKRRRKRKVTENPCVTSGPVKTQKKRGRKSKYEITEFKPENAKPEENEQDTQAKPADENVIKEFMDIIANDEEEVEEIKGVELNNEATKAPKQSTHSKTPGVSASIHHEFDHILNQLQDEMECGNSDKVLVLPDTSIVSDVQTSVAFNSLYNAGFTDDLRLPYDGSLITTLANSVPAIHAAPIEVTGNTSITLYFDDATIIDKQLDTMIEGTIVKALKPEKPVTKNRLTLYEDLVVRDGHLSEDIELISNSESGVQIREIVEDEDGTISEVKNYVPPRNPKYKRNNKSNLQQKNNKCKKDVEIPSTQGLCCSESSCGSNMISYDKESVQYKLLDHLKKADTRLYPHETPKIKKFRILLKRIKLPEKSTEEDFVFDSNKPKRRKIHLSNTPAKILSDDDEQLDLYGFRGFPESELTFVEDGKSLLDCNYNSDEENKSETSSSSDDDDSLIFSDIDGFRGFPELELDLAKENDSKTESINSEHNTHLPEMLMAENISTSNDNECITIQSQKLVENDEILVSELAKLTEYPSERDNAKKAKIIKLQSIIANEIVVLALPSSSPKSSLENGDCHLNEIYIGDRIAEHAQKNSTSEYSAEGMTSSHPDTCELAKLTKIPSECDSATKAKIIKLQSIFANEIVELPLPYSSPKNTFENGDCHNEEISIGDQIVEQPQKDLSSEYSVEDMISSHPSAGHMDNIVSYNDHHLSEESLQPIQMEVNMENLSEGEADQVDNENHNMEIPEEEEHAKLPQSVTSTENFAIDIGDFIDFETLIKENHITEETAKLTQLELFSEDSIDEVSEEQNLQPRDDFVLENLTAKDAGHIDDEVSSKAMHISAEVEPLQKNLTSEDTLSTSNQVIEDMSDQAEDDEIVMQKNLTCEDTLPSAGHVEEVMSNEIEISKEISVTAVFEREASAIEQIENPVRDESLKLNADKTLGTEGENPVIDEAINLNIDNTWRREVHERRTSSLENQEDVSSEISSEYGTEKDISQSKYKVLKKIRRLLLLLKKTTEHGDNKGRHIIKKKINQLQKHLPVDSTHKNGLRSQSSDSDAMSSEDESESFTSFSDANYSPNCQNSEPSTIVSLPEENGPQIFSAEERYNNDSTTKEILLYETDDGYESKLRIPSGHKLERINLSRKTARIRKNRFNIKLRNAYPEGKTAEEYLKNCDLELLL